MICNGIKRLGTFSATSSSKTKSPELRGIDNKCGQTKCNQHYSFIFGRNTPVCFPEGDVPDVFSAALTLANSVTDTQLSPAPRQTI